MKLEIQLAPELYQRLREGAQLLGRSPADHAGRLLAASLRPPVKSKATLPKSEAEYLRSTRAGNSKQPSPIITSLKKAAAQTK